jgi:hypothetical protein
LNVAGREVSGELDNVPLAETHATAVSPQPVRHFQAEHLMQRLKASLKPARADTDGGSSKGSAVLVVRVHAKDTLRARLVDRRHKIRGSSQIQEGFVIVASYEPGHASGKDTERSKLLGHLDEGI